MTAQEAGDDFGALLVGPLREEQTALHAQAELVRASDRDAASADALEFLPAPTDKDLDENGRVVVECRPWCFSKFLDVLRMREWAAWAGGDLEARVGRGDEARDQGRRPG
eukprot:g12179.t1